MSIYKDLIKYTPREEQEVALEYVKNIVKEKPDNKFFLMNLPTGTGKSYLAVMLSHFFTTKDNPVEKVDMVTSSKMLQNQYTETFDEIYSLKGKENYECSKYATNCSSGKEFQALNKKDGKCENCPYDKARNNYITSQVSLTNFHLYLINMLYGTGINEKRQAKLLIVDEADLLDNIMCDFITMKITETTIKKFRFTNESEILIQLKYVTSMESYMEFIKYFLEEIDQALIQMEDYLTTPREGDPYSAKRDKRINKISGILKEKSDDMKVMQLISELKQYAKKVEVFLEEFNEDPENWVLEKIYNEKSKMYEMSLEPIWAHKYLKKYIWDKYDYVVCMSATILDKKYFSEFNGIDESKAIYYSIPSPFPRENRLIYYMPCGKMSWNSKEATLPKLVSAVKKILKKYSDKKGLIHSNSYELQKQIKEAINDDRLLCHDSINKDEMLKEHCESNKPYVFVSPSSSTGLDMIGDLSRFQIVLKIPYPNLSSPKVKKRCENKIYMPYAAASVLVQSFGRSIRSKTDYAETFILDECFSDLLKYNSSLFPQWTLDSIISMKK
jgi:Rad3-related DNA helicase